MNYMCVYCNQEITLHEFANNNAESINVKDIYGMVENVWLHNNCLEKYIKEKKIFYCEQCYYYGYLITYNPNDEAKCEYFLNSDGLTYHKKCFPKNFCYDCQENKNNGPYYNFILPQLDDNKKDVLINEEKSVLFHKSCIEEDIRLCNVCGIAFKRICKYCKPMKFAYGCYNYCEYGYGNYYNCYYCY